MNPKAATHSHSSPAADIASGWSLSHAYALCGVFVAVLQPVFLRYTGHAVRIEDFVVVLVLALSLAVAGVSVPWTEFIFVLVYVGFEAVGLGDSIALSVFGVYFVAAVWVARGHVWWGLLMLTCVEAVSVLRVDDKGLHVVVTAFAIALTVVIGLVVRNKSRAVQQARLAADEARLEALRASSEVRAELSQLLHDTTARDLARISLASQHLQKDCADDVAAELGRISALAVQASQRLRPLIVDLDLRSRDVSLIDSVETARAMLATRGIELECEVSEGSSVRHATMHLASLVIREGAANILKYGRAPGVASLEIIVGDDVEISMINPVSEDDRRDHSGGFGLVNLRRSLEEAGGELSFAATASKWVLLARIPQGGIDE